MKIGITSDHRGFELKTKLIDYLKQKCYNKSNSYHQF